MRTERLELRIDAEQRRRLRQLADAANASVSETVRMLIDEAYAERDRVVRRAAARDLAALQVEDVPEPGRLAAELAGTYDVRADG